MTKLMIFFFEVDFFLVEMMQCSRGSFVFAYCCGEGGQVKLPGCTRMVCQRAAPRQGWGVGARVKKYNIQYVGSLESGPSEILRCRRTFEVISTVSGSIKRAAHYIFIRAQINSSLLT